MCVWGWEWVCVCDWNCQKQEANFACGDWEVEGYLMSVEFREENKKGKSRMERMENRIIGQRERAVIGIMSKF